MSNAKYDSKQIPVDYCTEKLVGDLNMSVFPYEPGRVAGYNAQLGLIVLQSDETLEYELRRILPEDGVALYTARIPSERQVSTDGLARLADSLTNTAALLPPELRYKVVGYGCTSGTAVIGAEAVAEQIKAGCQTAAVTEPLTALLSACYRKGIGRLAILSPYVEDVSATLRQRLHFAGIETPQFGSFNEASETAVANISAGSVAAAATVLFNRGGCEAIFISCTNLQTLEVIAHIEKQCGCPVWSSNLVLGWHMLKTAGLKARRPEIGTLLHELC